MCSMQRLDRSISSGLAASCRNCCDHTVAMLLPLAVDCCLSGGPGDREERENGAARRPSAAATPALAAAAAKGEDVDRGRLPVAKTAVSSLPLTVEGQEPRSCSLAAELPWGPLLIIRTVCLRRCMLPSSASPLLVPARGTGSQ